MITFVYDFENISIGVATGGYRVLYQDSSAMLAVLKDQRFLSVKDCIVNFLLGVYDSTDSHKNLTAAISMHPVLMWQQTALDGTDTFTYIQAGLFASTDSCDIV